MGEGRGQRGELPHDDSVIGKYARILLVLVSFIALPLVVGWCGVQIAKWQQWDAPTLLAWATTALTIETVILACVAYLTLQDNRRLIQIAQIQAANMADLAKAAHDQATELRSTRQLAAEPRITFQHQQLQLNRETGEYRVVFHNAHNSGVAKNCVYLASCPGKVIADAGDWLMALVPDLAPGASQEVGANVVTPVPWQKVAVAELSPNEPFEILLCQDRFRNGYRFVRGEARPQMSLADGIPETWATIWRS